MTWELGLNDVYPLMFPGKDDKRREQLFISVLDVYRYKPFHCLQVGVQSSDGEKLGESFISLDLYDKRDCIDVREDICDTSFPDSIFDLIVCNAILEHVKNPFVATMEMARICKPNGLIWAEVPFVQPYHPTKKKYEPEDGLLIGDYNKEGDGDFNHGGDYWRFTPQGVCEVMKPFTHLDIMLCSDGGIAFYGKNNKGY